MICICCLKKGIREDISQCSNRHSSADENTEIMYLDANNLYEWALSQMLPVSDYKWMDAQE